MFPKNAETIIRGWVPVLIKYKMQVLFSMKVNCNQYTLTGFLWCLAVLYGSQFQALSVDDYLCNNNAEHNIYVWSPVCLPVGSVGAIFVYIFTAELADLLISFAWFSLHWWLFLLMRFYWMFLTGSFSLCEVWKTVKGTNIQTLWTFFAW